MSVAEILRKPETLRKMLDERGVEHYDRFDVTEWVGADGEICHTSVTYSNGATVLVLRKCTTPEQAITATLGSGTCSIVARYMDWYCTGCGEMVGTCDVTHELHIDGNAIKLWRYCPNCGRKVVDE